MPLITTSHDSLPYIDPEPTPAQRAAAQALIDAEMFTLPSLPPSSTPTHPHLPPLRPSNLTPLLASEQARIESKTPIAAIDLSRYEELSAPSDHLTSAPSSEAWESVLRKAYTSSVYLEDRTKNLEALQASGKEEWLAGNEALVQILKGLEEELAETKEGIDRVALERKGAQDSVGGEVVLLERNWKDGVGRVLETELAAEGLRKEVLDRRRGGA